VSSERGQASAEMVAVLPLVVLVAAIVWQLALAGQALWLSAHAARAAARAEAVEEDPEDAARSVLPSSLERDLRVTRSSGAVRVELRIPMIARRWRSPVTVGASAALPQGEP
jgi:type II secretory pathway component PulK